MKLAKLSTIIMNQGDWRAVTTPHANFSWVPFSIQQGGRTFRPDPAWTLASEIDQTGGDRHVGKGGNDGADGLTYATRWLSLEKGLASTPANGRVLLYAGKYGWSDGGGPTSWPANNLSVIGMEDGVYIDSYFTAGAWALTAGQASTYETPFAVTLNTVIDYGTLDTDGCPTKYTAKTSIAEVEATAGTYWRDTVANKLYVHSLEENSPDADVRPQYTGGSYAVFTADNRKAYLENITYCGRNGTFLNGSATGGSAFYAKDCKFFYSNPAANALALNGVDAILQNCIFAHLPGTVDLIGGFARNTVVCKIIEIDCKMYDVGVGAGAQSWNCTTNHNAGKNVVINGEYYSAYGHPVGFINEGEAWLLGTYAHSSVSTDAGANANYQLDLSLCYMDCCKGDGSTKGFTPADTTIYGRNFVGDLTSTAGGSVTMTAY